MYTAEDLEARIHVLECRESIKELITRYGLVLDDRDMTAIPGLFTEDVCLSSMDGTMAAKGRDEVLALFEERFEGLGPSNHFTHDKIIRFSDDMERATGVVVSHVEWHRLGRPMLAAMRYHDSYRFDAGSWRFSERVLAFFYYVPVAEYLDALGPGLDRRYRAHDEPRSADFPESLESWRSYYGNLPN